MTDLSKGTQCKRILDYLENNPFITAKIARDLFRCERLASRINDLKRRGIPITRKIITYVDDEGQHIRYAMYWLKKEVQAS